MNAHEKDGEQVITLRTNMDDVVEVGPENPMRFVIVPENDGVKPYVLVRGRLEAVLARPVMYELIAHGEEIEVDGRLMFAVRSKVRSVLLEKLQFSGNEQDGDYQCNLDMKELVISNAKKHAAVLIGLIERDEQVNVILTMRTEKLNNHSGQVAFPGGRIDETDASPESAALREAWEEIGLDINEVEIMGRLPDYYSGSGYRIAPIIGFVREGADFEVSPDEVDYMFEVPLSFLMDESNHNIMSKVWNNTERHFYTMPYEDHYIWGVTAEEKWLQEETLQRLFDILCADGGEARVAGGAVRNALMGMDASDVDLCTTLLPQEVVQRLESAGEKAVPTGIEHGTITAVLDGKGFEVTTLRKDIETNGRHAVVEFGTDWEADANRRDLTINGLYCDRAGRVYDFVDGYGDILNKEVRFIGDAAARIKEDSLRILRFFRFFAWYGGGRPDANGLKACAAGKSLLVGLSAERVWMELKKLLAAPDPGRAVLWMRTTGILGSILPESEKWGTDAIPGLLRMEQEQEVAS
ncbi:CCA tRNA nucleotidyltransferase 1, mitochondrial [Nymphon striatum]|nr:CCA tRNA nucleotidyltransferase 1, mitochondrial [Nymphon striatum]